MTHFLQLGSDPRLALVLLCVLYSRVKLGFSGCCFLSHTFRKGVEDSQRVRRRRHVNRERTDSTSSSSIYFTASQDVGNTNEETSEGGYVVPSHQAVSRGLL